MISPQDLILGIKEYENDIDESLVKKAYVFALERHGTQLRESGDPFFSHPLEVAEILISLKMDQQTVVSGILHDTIEDTSATKEEIEKHFGKEIAKIVGGVTKLSKFEGSTLAQEQTENFKKLLLAAASDIRILVIKLADRLHNMRTLKYKKNKTKRQTIAKETIEIYASLAERVGMANIQDELQDISFQELYPEIYDSIKEKLGHLYAASDSMINFIGLELAELVKSLGIECSISGRMKTPYSIWQKMNVRNISLEQLSDIMAFRLIVDSIQHCYQLLGGIHRKYLVVPGRFRDYISAQKPNGYQSLHTCVIGPLSKRIEIQIRTKEMHKVAEYGIAAHWSYKDKDVLKENAKNGGWLRNLAQILENASSITEFFENSKTEMFADCVFCITPKGVIISLPKGSSALDFAYAIHSDIGNHAVEAKINGKSVPLKTIIENGDQVEILTDPKSMPSSNWGNYVVTIKAKTGLRKALNGIEKERIAMIGKANFYEFFENRKLEISAEDIKKIFLDLGFDNESNFFHSIGGGATTLREIFSEYNKIRGEKDVDLHEEQDNSYVAQESAPPIIGLPNLPVLPISCCSPVPGDKIIGLLFPEKGVEIHIDGCQAQEQAILLNAKHIELDWTKDAFSDSLKYMTKLSITMVNEAGNLSKVASIVENNKATIANLKVKEKMESFVDILIEIEVLDSFQVAMIIASVRNLEYVNKVVRN